MAASFIPALLVALLTVGVQGWSVQLEHGFVGGDRLVLGQATIAAPTGGRGLHVEFVHADATVLGRVDSAVSYEVRTAAGDVIAFVPKVSTVATQLLR